MRQFIPKLDVLKRRDFRWLLSTRVLVMMGLQAQDLIINWQVFSITHSYFMLGLSGLTEAVPAIISALFAGHIVDTNRPHRVMTFALCGLCVNAIALCLFAGGYMQMQPSDLLPILFMGIFFSGLARAFVMPSYATLLSQAVPRAEISSAAALSSSGQHSAAIIGPSVAGVIYGVWGAHIVWFLPALLMLPGLVFFRRMSAPLRAYHPDHVRESMFKSIRAGWHYILTNPTLLSVMLLDMFAVLFGGAVAMLPPYAAQVLHVGSEGLGALRAATGIGAILMGVFLAARPMKNIRATTLLWAVAGFGICIIGFALSKSFILSMILLAASGAFDGVSMVIRGTLMQLLTTNEVRGRVSAVNSMFIISSNEIGAFEAGAAATYMGLVPSVVFGGVMCLVVVGATALLSPKFRRTRVDAEV